MSVPHDSLLGLGSDPCARDAEVQGGIPKLQLWRDPGPLLDSLEGHHGVVLHRSPEPIAAAISQLCAHFPVKLLLLCPLCHLCPPEQVPGVTASPGQGHSVGVGALL